MLNKISNLYWLYLKSKSTVIAISSRASGVLLVSACRTLLPSHHVVKITSAELLSADQKTWVSITCGEVCLLRNKIDFTLFPLSNLFKRVWTLEREENLHIVYLHSQEDIHILQSARCVCVHMANLCTHVVHSRSWWASTVSDMLYFTSVGSDLGAVFATW